jgi:Uma2 family endonuclease
MSAQTIAKIPLLQPGDRLTTEEFLRRYEAMPEVRKAELIEGVVYLPSPVSHTYHGAPHCKFVAWIGLYSAFTPGIEGGDNSTLRLKVGFNVPQPDAFLRVLPEFGGRLTTGSKGYLVGSPEWIGEISASSASYDLHDKLAAYQLNGVEEYVVWRVLDRAIDWFLLQNGKYRRLAVAKDGYYKSKVFPGLWLDPGALIRGNLARVLTVVQKGPATAEHKRFVARLEKWKTDHPRR